MLVLLLLTLVSQNLRWSSLKEPQRRRYVPEGEVPFIVEFSIGTNDYS